MLVRTGGKGFPVLPPCNISSVMAAVQRVVGAALLYTWGGKQKNEATEAAVEEWVRRWKKGEERRTLITDERISRGWEAKELMAIGSVDILQHRESCYKNLWPLLSDQN